MAEKLSIIHKTHKPDAAMSIVARRYGIQPSQLFACHKLATQGLLTATVAEEDVIPMSEYLAL
jgi:transposase